MALSFVDESCFLRKLLFKLLAPLQKYLPKSRIPKPEKVLECGFGMFIGHAK